MQFLARKSGLSGDGGSLASTSTAAPARRPLLSFSQVLLYNQRATRRVDEKRARFHQGQGPRVDNSLGLREQRAMQTYDIRPRQQFIDFTPSKVGPV